MGERAKRGRRRGPGRARSGEAATRREEILQVAARLFASRGFEATSVRDIAEAVGILSGSLYHHFATKEAMLHEILRGAEPLTRHTTQVAGADADPETRLAALAILRLKTLVADPVVFGIIYNNRTFFRERPEFDYVERAKSEGFEAVAGVLEEGIRQGLFRADLDVFLTIGTLYRLLAGAADWFTRGGFVRLERPPREYSLDEVIDYHLELIFRLVRADGRIDAPIPRAEAEALLAPLEPDQRGAQRREVRAAKNA
ncbi:MAG: hypothetical protein KatS3mg124_0168 [Porticoccaceae bacterium]|nr:MAG: hypothetical protein KatS3mg124_0168 [Porticoccaceae bacterium]